MTKENEKTINNVTIISPEDVTEILNTTSDFLKNATVQNLINADGDNIPKVREIFGKYSNMEILHSINYFSQEIIIEEISGLMPIV